MEFPRFIDTVKKGKSRNIIVVGIDRAKNVFAVHGINESGKPVLIKPRVFHQGLG